jgi:hypothetical protein
LNGGWLPLQANATPPVLFRQSTSFASRRQVMRQTSTIFAMGGHDH